MSDAVHPSRMIIIRIVLYKDRFDVYITNARYTTIRIALNRWDVSGQDRWRHASFLRSCKAGWSMRVNNKRTIARRLGKISSE
jgi:hypothetical protein